MTDVGAGSPHHFEDGRDDVDDVVILVSDRAGVLDLRGPGDDERVGVAARVRVLLPALQRRVAGHRPAHRIVRVGGGAARIVELLEHLLDRVREVVAVAIGVQCAVRQSLLGRAVVGHQDDERVVADSHLIERGEHPAELMIRVFDKPGEDLLQSAVDFLLAVVQIGPRLDAGIRRRQHGVFRDDPELLLTFKGLFPHLVPALVKRSFIFRDELLRGVQGRVGRAKAR